MKIIRCIQTVYPIDRHSQLMSWFVYGRIAYPDYDMAQGDEVDQLIIQQVDQNSKPSPQGEQQTRWFFTEFDQGAAHYRAVRFRGKHEHAATIRVTPTINPLPDDLETINRRNLVDIEVPAVWITSRRPGDEDLERLKTVIPLSISWMYYDQWASTIVDPFAP